IPTPTMIMMETPPNGTFVPTPSRMKVASGIIATAARYIEPGAVILDSTYSRYSAVGRPARIPGMKPPYFCLLYTSDAADDLTRVDLGGRRIIKKKKKNKT